MTKRFMILALAAVLSAAPAPAAAQRMTDEERRELEQRLEQLRQEMRQLERRLGRTVPRVFSFSGDAPAVFLRDGSRPRLGVIVQTGRNETDSIGALLQAVTPDGPAHDAGLRAGDIVVTFDGQVLANARPNPGDRLIELARGMEVGDTVAVRYRRDLGPPRTATVVPEVLNDFAFSIVDSELPGRVTVLTDSARVLSDRLVEPLRSLERVRLPTVRIHQDGVVIGPGARWSDMELVELNEDLGSYFGAAEGLLVVRAPSDDFLQLKAGDVILRIGGRSLRSPSHAVRILRSYEPGDEIRLDIMRERQRRELTARVPEREGA